MRGDNCSPVLILVLVLTLACGAIAFWLALQNPTLVEKLFYTALGMFAAGACAIIEYVRRHKLSRDEVNESPPLLPPIASSTRREAALRRTRRRKSPPAYRRNIEKVAGST
jgi:hypothetical protein